MPLRRPSFSVALGAALLVPALLLAGCGQGEPVQEPPRPVLVQQPQPAEAAVQAFAGDVRARHETLLAFRVGGKLAQREVEVGQRVRAGQVLARLDGADLRLAREAAEARLAAAEAEARLAAAEFERVGVLFERQLVSRSLFDARRSAREAADAQVGQARAQLRVAANQAAYGDLRAPADGVVAERFAEAGQVLAAGQPVFVVAEDGDREVAIALPESELARFTIGQPVQVELWAASERRLPGRFREIAPAADPATRTFAARVAIETPVGVAVELGQSARVYAVRSTAVALSVPLSALTEVEGRPALWVLNADRRSARRQEVEIGPYGPTSVPVLAGLAADDWVVVAGVHLLREGQPLRPLDRENRPLPAAPAAANDAG
ncbi:efflux RND transporter periplasmic adaptor subunit [Silanimonas sp.]|uniref:efflux RND transporter periplasmic adaptor subunit n=1 Tax=Silanimonas sp. TaxID=1929290 RepID=UPI001BBB5394|nr:efflux RND transporter periplasmic adaptor subunit [Silanimonas sp.]MBS3895894.1 efflux RND transporter periplasmic adaptor subunit [Silanimonas sp.]MBS3924602.1 efflux RND transporter periplasmic adaptor subunit [Xanthomonadaceae bacterium]